MPDQFEQYYKYLKTNGADVAPDFNSFKNTLSNYDNASKYYSYLKDNQFDVPATYDSFADTFGLKKKDGGEISSPTELPSVSREYLDKGQELADGSFLKKIGKLDRSQLVSQYKSPDISLTQKPKKDYYSTKLEKGLIFDKEGQLYAPSSEALSKDITAAEQASLKKSTQKDLVEKSREMPVVEPTEPIEEQGLLLNLISSFDKSFAKNFISNPMKGLGTFLQGTTKKVLGGSGEGDLSNFLIKYGDYLNNAIDELTPQDEEFKNSLWDQAAQALGQVGSLILTGGLTGASGKAALVAQAPKGAVATAASRIASQLSAPTSISAGLSMGQAEFDRAKQAGATDDQAFEAFYKNAVTGSVLETIPVMQFFKRFNKATAGGFVNYLKTKGVAGFTGGVEEMTTEILQQLYANKTAKDIYNINQSILDGVGSSGGIGFGVGFLLNAMGANARILRKQGKTQDAIAIENQIEQYEDNLKNPKVTSGNTAKDIVTQGVEIGTQKAVQDLDRDLANNVITPEKYQEGIAFAEKAAQVVDKIPETVTGESKVKSVELLVERNDIKQANDNLIQQKQSTDEAYHAGIDEEIKANEERIKKIDSEVYNIAKKPSKEFGDKKYVVDGEEVSKEAFEALQGKPIGTKEVIKVEKPTQEQEFKETAEGNLVTFTYKSEKEVPEAFKNRVSSTGENTLPDGTIEKIVRVTVPKSLADYELAKAEVKPTEVIEEGDDLILSHGTKHDFDKFQLEKIGTGEGAQAFGYGLYFTDGSKIAEGYAKKLSEDNTGLVYSVKIKNGKLANWAEWRSPLDESVESSFYNKLTKEEKSQYQDYVDNQFNSGKDKNYTGSFGDLELSKEGFLEYPTFEKPSASGNLYQDLKAAFGQGKATEIFKRAGIDGIKYESQGGYGNENNYVVFNPESIEIIKKSKGREEVKPTEVKEVKAEVVKPKVEKQAEPKTLSVENKEYTTKTGRQKVVLKNSDLKVIDIKTGKEASPATRRKALDEYVERYDR